jgi:hypothetical protein
MGEIGEKERELGLERWEKEEGGWASVWEDGGRRIWTGDFGRKFARIS